MSLFSKTFQGLVIFLAIFFLVLPGINAQDAIDGVEEKKEAVWRLGFWEVLHQTFSDDESHPFYQMTGTNRFKSGKGFFGTTFVDIGGGNILPNVYLQNQDGQKNEDGFFTKILSKIPFINGLPTFSLEYILPTDYFVGIGLNFAYTNIWLDDELSRAATTGGDQDYATPLIRLTSHFYMFSLAIHPFGVPKNDDIDIFLGAGLARVESTLRYGIRANPNIADEASITRYRYSGSSGFLTYRRMGIASGGDRFGFLLEFIFTGNNKIIENPFYSDPIIDYTTYNATYNDRGESLPNKVGIKGGITRFSWTYSF